VARAGAFTCLVAFAASVAAAQTCPCPPKPTPGWHGNAGAGLALTSGNSDTQTYNLNALVVYDPQRRNVVKIDGLYLRSKAQGEDTADKAAFGVRDEYGLGRAFLFGEVRYQRDRFKLLDSLIAPTVGAGYKLIDDKRVALGVDAGLGLAIESLEGRERTTDGALHAGEGLSWAISDNSKLIQAATALWKIDDFADAFYHLEAGLASSINSRLELKVAGLVDVKNKPAAATIQKTDKALLASLVFKF
jgi:putative salt-induced outer membrane protein YdiY